MSTPASSGPAARTVAIAAACLALAATAGGCAPSVTPSPLSQPLPTETTVTVQTQTQRSETIIRRDDFVSISEVAVPRSIAWRHLRQAWADAGLPEPVADERAFTLTLANHTLTRRLGGVPLSTYLSCGRSMTGWHADTHRIRLTVRALLEPAGPGHSRLHTRVDATAHSTEGTSSTPLECTSKGSLEELIARRVGQLVAAGSPD